MLESSCMNQAHLEELRGLLESRSHDLRLQLEQSEDTTKPVTLDQQSVGRVSRIDAIQQQQMAIAGKTQASQQLRQIELALQRIEGGEYGDCLECGEPILLARLQIQPEARLCVACQSRIETG